jgi:PIF1-like helicase
MPTPAEDWEAPQDNYLLQQEMAYDMPDLTLEVENLQASFNPEQRAIFDAVLDSVRNNEGKVFFLQSAGGCGKTYVCNTIAAAVRAMGHPALCVASSAIAALLLDGGRTAHSRFKIPIPIFENSFCGISKNAHLKELIKETKVIIWDEASMQHRHAIEALDRTLRDILQQDRLFGGLTVLFGGDFRQTLPVIARGSREQIINASFRKSRIWRHIQVFHLTENRRLEQSPESVAFAQWLLQVGEGRGLSPDKTITLPRTMITPQNTLENLIDLIYPNIAEQPKPDSFFLDRTILTSRNDCVDEINTRLLDRFPGEETTLWVSIKWKTVAITIIIPLNISALCLSMAFHFPI